jgi:cell filamentation protein
VFTELHSENLLAELPNDKHVKRFAYYYSEINILHPFREGNGRAQCAFFTLLAIESGRRIRWGSMDPGQNLTASIAAYTGDKSGLVAMLTLLIARAH